jgi:hypothetical protein
MNFDGHISLRPIGPLGAVAWGYRTNMAYAPFVIVRGLVRRDAMRHRVNFPKLEAAVPLRSKFDYPDDDLGGKASAPEAVDRLRHCAACVHRGVQFLE